MADQGKITEKEARERKYFTQTSVIKCTGIAKNTIKNYRLQGVFQDVLADAKYGDTYFLSVDNIKAIIDRYNASEKLDINIEDVLNLLHMESEYKHYDPERTAALEEIKRQGYELPSPLNNWTKKRVDYQTETLRAEEPEVFESFDSIPRREEGSPTQDQPEPPPINEDFIIKVVETMVGNMKEQLQAQIKQIAEQSQFLLEESNKKADDAEKKAAGYEMYYRKEREYKNAGLLAKIRGKVKPPNPKDYGIDID